MMSRAAAAILLLVSVVLTPLALQGVERARSADKTPQAMRVVLPVEVVRLFAGEFSSVVSDYLLLESMVAYAQAQEALGKNRQSLKADTVWLESMLDAATELDPQFYDPYYFAAMTLPWDLGSYEWSIRLLEKGAEALKDDWSLLYYAGFQSFYFLQDYPKASKLLFAASERPGAPKAFLTSLGSRLSYQGNQTAIAISFLEQIIDEIDEAPVREEFERRLVTLKLIDALEKAVSAYAGRLGRYPASLDDLVSEGVVRGLPDDPYGGVFYLDKDHSVKTTSNMRPINKD